jgi:hypothetical protein
MVAPLPVVAGLPGYSLVPGAEALGPGGVALAPNTRTTSPILALLAPLHLPQSVLNRLFAPYPIAGKGNHPAAGGPGGVDVNADAGTQVVVSLEGTLHLDQGAGPGQRTAALTAADGTVHTVSHLDGFAPELVDGQHVSIGDPLGSVGGASAPGEVPHIHFDIRPLGGPSTDPVPQLDQWLARALINAQALTGRGARKAPSASPATASRGLLKSAAAVGPGAATMLPGLGIVGFGVWFGSTRILRRRREQELASDMAVEFVGPVDFASRFVIRPPALGHTQPWWQAWWERQAWIESLQSRFRERRFKWW